MCLLKGGHVMLFPNSERTSITREHVHAERMGKIPSIYLDASATTPVDRRVLEEMLPFFMETFGNPSSQHEQGQVAGQAVRKARQQASTFLGCTPRELIFTGSGSEGDNLAIKGVVWRSAPRRVTRHIITSSVEHHAVGRTCEQLERELGCVVTRIPVDKFGIIDPDVVRAAIRPETVLVSIMQANNEVGSVQPVSDIAAIAREFEVPFHVDAVQAAPWLDVSTTATNADLISISGHKLYGPKGVGALYARQDLRLATLIAGGGQEFGLRSGTENVPLIVGLGEALCLVQQRRFREVERVQVLRDQLIEGVLEQIEGACLTGHPINRLPHHASFVFNDVDAHVLLEMLSAEGIMASSGSACSSGNFTPSHVLVAMGVPSRMIEGSLRLTLGYETTQEDINTVLDVLPRLVSTIRRYRPVF